MESKIRIKIGQAEIEYEGSEAFLKGELVNFIQTIMEFSKVISIPLNETGKQIDIGIEPLQMATSSIAAKLNCKSGSELVMAAAANLNLVKKKDTFSRQELLSEMKSAKEYYKKSYRGNLTNSIATLIKNGTLNEIKKDHYALSAGSRKDIQDKLAS